MSDKDVLDAVLKGGDLKCPKCHCNSLKEGFNLNNHMIHWDKTFFCVAGCGINFSIRKSESGMELGSNGNLDVVEKDIELCKQLRAILEAPLKDEKL